MRRQEDEQDMLAPCKGRNDSSRSKRASIVQHHCDSRRHGSKADLHDNPEKRTFVSVCSWYLVPVQYAQLFLLAEGQFSSEWPC